MPAKSKAQQRFFGVVKGIQKGTGKGTGKAKKAAKDMSKDDVDDFASTKHKGLPNKVKREHRVKSLIRKMVREIMAEDFAGAYPKHMRKKFDGKRRKQAEVLGYTLTGKNDIKTEIGNVDEKEYEAHYKAIKEAKAKRDYKAEYKKFQSSKKAKKYRAELNAYNRKKGTYGNGDGKDASHKGGKIVGFEAESKNRGRREKSRLKKEGKLTETKFYAFWNRKKYPIDGTSLWDAKKKAIEKLKIPKSKYGLLAIMNAAEHDRMSKISWVKQEGKLKEAKESIFDVAARVLKNKQHEKYKGVRIDLQTANLLSTVYSKVNNKMRGILTKLGDQNIKQLLNTLWAVAR